MASDTVSNAGALLALALVLLIGWFGIGTILGWILGIFGLGDSPWRKR